MLVNVGILPQGGLMKAGKIRGLNDKGEEADLDMLVANPAALRSYLGRELGVSLQLEQERSLSKALQKPEDFIAEREQNIDTILKGQVSDAFARAVNDLKNVQLPEEMFEALVKKRAQNALAEAMEIENLRHPGYEFAINKQKQAREMMEDRSGSEADIIARYKANKKAKKAAKAAGSSS